MTVYLVYTIHTVLLGHSGFLRRTDSTSLLVPKNESTLGCHVNYQYLPISDLRSNPKKNIV